MPIVKPKVICGFSLSIGTLNIIKHSNKTVDASAALGDLRSNGIDNRQRNRRETSYIEITHFYISV